jgi:hypothetical protein
MVRLPRCDPFFDLLLRNAFAAIERGKRRCDPRDLPFVCIEIGGDCFGREERARASRGPGHFFEALLQRVSNAHGDGCGAWCFHNVYIVSQAAQRAMKEGSGEVHAARRSGEERTEIGNAAHEDWARGGSRISGGKRRAGRGVERWRWLRLLRAAEGGLTEIGAVDAGRPSARH